jgi:hypothetical protein
VVFGRFKFSSVPSSSKHGFLLIIFLHELLLTCFPRKRWFDVASYPQRDGICGAIVASGAQSKSSI